MSISFETTRLVIRQFRDSDLEPFVAYRNDPVVCRYQGWKIPYLREDAREFISRSKFATPGTPGEWLQLVIECKESSEMLGDVAFHIAKSNPRQAYLGYTLAHSAWGKGFAREAVSKILDYLFRVLDLHRVIADCDVENAASIRLLERLGFRREAHYVESFWRESESCWGNEYLYAILQREWVLR